MFGRIAFLSGATLQALLSRSFCSLFCLSGTVFVGLCSLRYSEGQPGNRYYGGNEVIDKAQCGAAELWLRFWFRLWRAVTNGEGLAITGQHAGQHGTFLFPLWEHFLLSQVENLCKSRALKAFNLDEKAMLHGSQMIAVSARWEFLLDHALKSTVERDLERSGLQILSRLQLHGFVRFAQLMLLCGIQLVRFIKWSGMNLNSRYKSIYRYINIYKDIIYIYVIIIYIYILVYIYYTY